MTKEDLIKSKELWGSQTVNWQAKDISTILEAFPNVDKGTAYAIYYFAYVQGYERAQRVLATYGSEVGASSALERAKSLFK